MADDAGERTENPTARRLQEARNNGRIPRSPDLTAAVGLLGAILLLWIFGGNILAHMLSMTRAFGEAPPLSPADLKPTIARTIYDTVRVLLPFLILLMIITVIGIIVQAGLPVSLKKLEPKLSQLNPINGFKRMFSVSALTRLGMGILKMVFIAGVAYFSLVGEIGRVLSAGTLSAVGAFDVTRRLLLVTALKMAVALLVLALIDYAYQRWDWWRKLKMTKQEVKDEMKNMEGDQKVKQRQRQVQSSIAMQRIGMDVPKADVVVTNPTEFAVAIRYDQETMAAPRVIAKGKDLLALRIRQVAQQHGVPVVQRPPLARALYAAVEIGQEVPPAFYQAVAEILAYVYQLGGKRVSA